MTRKSCAVGMRNAIPRNHLGGGKHEFKRNFRKFEKGLKRKILILKQHQIFKFPISIDFKNHQKIYKTAQNIDMWDEHRDS